jgi:hypothetical protein
MSKKQTAGVIASLVLAAPVLAGEVTGKYLGNGKPGKLAHAVVVPHEPWNNEPAYTLVLYEKEPTGSMGLDTQAMFGKLGDALTITVTKSGSIIGTQVCHQALKKSGFSSVGSLKAEGLKIEAGSLSGRFYTEKEQEFFGDTWDVDLKVKAALPAGK